MKRILLLLYTGMLLTGCESEEVVEEPLRPVALGVAEYKPDTKILTFTGFSKSGTEIIASFRVPGKIKQIPIKVGDQLEEGSLISQLEDDDYVLELSKSNAALEEAKAEARNASSTYKRYKQLYESESVSRNELDSARATHESAQAAVEKATSAVSLARQQLNYTTLYALRTHCYVATKTAEIDENVTAGQEVATLVCGTRLEVEIAVAEKYIADFEQGMPVDIIFNAIPGKSFFGKVTEVGVVAQEGTTFPVTIVLDKPSIDLRSGMAVKVLVAVDLPVELLLVPLAAVGEDNEGKFVFLFEEQEKGFGIVRRKGVKVGKLHKDGIQILGGLTIGDRVVVAGVRWLSDGREVKVLDTSIEKRIMP